MGKKDRKKGSKNQEQQVDINEIDDPIQLKVSLYIIHFIVSL
jgi:hypothetical protein